MMTVPQVCELVHLMKEEGIECPEGDEVGLMRAKKFYRSLGWREDYDFYIYGGKVYFDIDWRPVRVSHD